MTDSIDNLFKKVRSRRFAGGMDPNVTVHEVFAGSGNPQPSGWYEGHSFSSFVGQANALYDPTFESIDGPGLAGAVAIATTASAAGHWTCHHTVISGAAPTTARNLVLLSRRGYPHQAPFASGVAAFQLTYSASTASSVDYYLYPSITYQPAFIPTLDYMVASVRLFKYPGHTDFSTFTVATALIEILKDGVVVASGGRGGVATAYDYKAAADYEHVQLLASYKDTAANFRGSAWLWRVKMRIERSAAEAGTPTIYQDMGEPQLHFNFQPTPLPFQPAIGNWFPTRIANSFALGGDLTPTALSANTDNWNPAGMSLASVLRIQTDASRNLTGIVRGADGQVLYLMNVGANNLVLMHDVTSTAANRFLCPGSVDLTLTPNSGRQVLYDDQSLRWRVVG